MKILSIGNSFSQDAQRYLHQIARADGYDLQCFNLYIGGCPLSYHFRNMLSEQANYILEMNGYSTGFRVSLKEAVLSHDWDLITLQQVSSQSYDFDTFEPYLSKVAEYVRALAPKAKIVIHQTWGYSSDSPRMATLNYGCHEDMFHDVKSSYDKAAKKINADFLIPSGQVLHDLLASGIPSVHRDCHHASFGLGRYAIGLMWYRALTGNSVLTNSFSDFDEEISETDIQTAKTCVEQIVL